MAYYDRKGKDIVVATDRRWVCGAVGNYSVCSDDGVKSAVIARNVAIAFTGHAEVMARIVGCLFDDPSLAEKPHTEALVRLEAAPREIPCGVDGIVERLNDVVPKGYAATGSDLDCSVIVAGDLGDGPTMFWWAEDTEWKGEQNKYSDFLRVRVLPKGVLSKQAVWKRADTILDGHGPVVPRIQRVVKFLSESKDVQSVGGGCVIRRYSKGFILPSSSSPEPDPSISPSHADADT